MFKYNPQNGRKATSVSHIVSVALTIVSEVNIVSHLPSKPIKFRVAKLVYTKPGLVTTLLQRKVGTQ